MKGNLISLLRDGKGTAHEKHNYSRSINLLKNEVTFCMSKLNFIIHSSSVNGLYLSISVVNLGPAWSEFAL